MQKYKQLFFDLDHTIWDFSTNERITLTQLFSDYQLDKYFNDFNNFFELYKPINLSLWEQYRNGKIKKKELNIQRFYNTFVSVGFDNKNIAEHFANDFIAINPTKTALIPHTIEVLNYLKPHYRMHIITNGFTETQYVKIEKSGLKPYFEKIFVSEEVGYQKPKKAFFEYAIKSCNARKKESLVIGDSIDVDIQGAKNFGLDHVFFNPLKTVHNELVFKEISSLIELTQWL